MKAIKIPFNRPCWVGSELANISDSMKSGHVSGNGEYTKKAQSLLRENLNSTSKVLLTTSCTHALEMTAILLDLQPGDEVIVPSFTFVSTALAFVMHGAIPVFADIRPDTLNIDEATLESLISGRTRAIVPVHYAGVSCDMDAIMDIAERYNLIVIEDNAHGLFGTYNGRNLGSIGHMATQSFHETKNIICGEGGALVINDSRFSERAEILLEKGTNRANFFRGEVDKYTWVDKGSSYLMSNILAACLYGQLLKSSEIQKKRKIIWNTYFDGLKAWAITNGVQLPYVPDGCEQAFHMFYLILPSAQARSNFIDHMNSEGISTVFHYLPLHESPMGKKFNTSNNKCPVTSETAGRLVRLPFFIDLTHEQLNFVIGVVKQYQI